MSHFMKVGLFIACAVCTFRQNLAQNIIQSGDVVFLRTHAGAGKQLHVDGTSVRGNWNDHGNWQALTIRKDGSNEIHSNDAVFLTGHTGNQIDVEGVAVQCRWDEFGEWQRFSIEKLSSGPIRHGDVVCLRAHTGKYLDWNGGDVLARFEECALWQQMIIEREDPQAIRSGSAVYLRTHTGKHIDVDGTSVQARFDDRGLWQRLTVETRGGRAVWSGDTVFLKAHTNKLLDVQGVAVQARFDDRGLWQSLVLEKDGGGPVLPGDHIFLRSSHTSKHIDVENNAVRARWHDQGTWQKLVIEQERKPSTTLRFTSTSGMIASTSVTKTTLGASSTTTSAQVTTITRTTSSAGTSTSPGPVDDIVTAVMTALKNADSAGVFKYDTGKGWVESDVYTWPDMIQAVRLMATNGVGNAKLWLGDSGETNVNYGLVNVAAFLAQSMQETIQYNACDENNWSEGKVVAKHGGAVYSATSACGQLHQSYQDYTCSAEDDAIAAGKMACDVDPDMELRAYTQAGWHGAPAKLFCAPRSKVPKAPRWDPNGPWCAPPGGWGHVKPFEANVSLDTYLDYVNDGGSCRDYHGIKSGSWKFTGAGCKNGACPGTDAPLYNRPERTDVEGCCWWGRGVIQTTGVCNFGKLNFYLGKRAADEGRSALYPSINFCKEPGKICAPDSPPELKWVAGLFYWLNAVQPYSRDGWNYKAELEKWVDGGMNLADTGFINGASGIVNRGCHNPPCHALGEPLDGGANRIANFKTVLQALRLTLV